MNSVYIINLCRTAIGNFGGSLKEISASQLGSIAIIEAMKRSGVKPSQIDEVILGNVLQAGQGQNPARQAALGAEIPNTVPAVTINKVCGSGLYSLHLAKQAILAGDAECIIAGGMESMSNSPYSLPRARWGCKMGDATAQDLMIHDGLWDAFNDYHMGITAENIAKQYAITRDMQDQFSLKSQQKASHAQKAGIFQEEIVPVSIPQKRKDPLIFETDEYPRPNTNLESLSKLKPAFTKDGTVTAGSSSGINDGAAIAVVASEGFVKKHNLSPMAKIITTASAGVDPSVMGLGPIPAMKKALKSAYLRVEDLDLIEANEAFAVQAIAVLQELGLDEQRVNVNGGSIALGHPIGASGARILTTLLYEMKRRGSRYGAATLCIGGGMGEAMIVQYMGGKIS